MHHVFCVLCCEIATVAVVVAAAAAAIVVGAGMLACLLKGPFSLLFVFAGRFG